MDNLIAQGRYRARAVDAQLGLSKSNSEQVGIGFEILDEGQYEGWHITGFFSFSDAAADYTLEKMRNAGWQGDDVSDLSSLCPAEGECVIVIRHEEYEGKTQVKVAFVNKPGTGKVKMAAPLEGAAASSFAARMRAKAIASRQEGGRPASSAPARTGNGGRPAQTDHPFAPGGAADDDIPF